MFKTVTPAGLSSETEIHVWRSNVVQIRKVAS